jgi:DNA-binding NarL/FixJ family response regulator
MVEQHLEPMARSPKTPSLDALSSREREVLALIADGLSNAAIAHRLDLSEHTVKRHVANILVKLDLPTRAAAAAIVARQHAG